MKTGKTWVYTILIIAPLLIMFCSLFMGRYPLPMVEVAQIIWCKILWLSCPFPDIHQVVVWEIRLPRAILAALVGGSLAVSGACFQGLFRNPLVSSGILGVSSGAGFGAALAIILFSHGAPVYLFAMVFGAVAVN